MLSAAGIRQNPAPWPWAACAMRDFNFLFKVGPDAVGRCMNLTVKAIIPTVLFLDRWYARGLAGGARKINNLYQPPVTIHKSILRAVGIIPTALNIDPFGPFS